jgi:hypothetical protein
MVPAAMERTINSSAVSMTLCCGQSQPGNPPARRGDSGVRHGRGRIVGATRAVDRIGWRIDAKNVVGFMRWHEPDDARVSRPIL